MSKDCMTAGRFSEILAHEKWKQIDDMVTALDAADYWDDDLTAAAITRFKKEHCRRMARSMKRDDGGHVFVHVVNILPSGDRVHLYKQQMLFDIDDYRFAVNYHKQQGIHHMVRANALARDCQTFLGKQLPLPFPSIVAA